MRLVTLTNISGKNSTIYDMFRSWRLWMRKSQPPWLRPSSVMLFSKPRLAENRLFRSSIGSNHYNMISATVKEQLRSRNSSRNVLHNPPNTNIQFLNFFLLVKVTVFFLWCKKMQVIVQPFFVREILKNKNHFWMDGLGWDCNGYLWTESGRHKKALFASTTCS